MINSINEVKFNNLCMAKANEGLLLVKCKHCGNKHTMVFQDGGDLPTCSECTTITGNDWSYSLTAIDYLKKHYPIASVL